MFRICLDFVTLQDYNTGTVMNKGSDISESGANPELCLSNRDANERARLSRKGSHWGRTLGRRSVGIVRQRQYCFCCMRAKSVDLSAASGSLLRYDKAVLIFCMSGSGMFFIAAGNEI